MSANEKLSKEDLLKTLNELLEAERAGARITLETAKQVVSKSTARLVEEIQRDEVRWCKMLMNQIRSMGEFPSSTTGSFYEKAIAITDIQERISFINRGQAWVVRRLQGLIPQIDDVTMQNELSKMLEAHMANIERVNKETGAL